MREKGQGIGKRYNEDSFYRDSFSDVLRLLESTENAVVAVVKSNLVVTIVNAAF